MNATTQASIPSAVERLSKALRDNQLNEAEKLLASFEGKLPESAHLHAAELHLRRRRFTQAVDLFGRVPHLDIDGRLKLNAARNYAALQLHRPAVYQRLLAATINDRYRLVPIPGNRLTIADFKAPQKPTLLTPGGDPVAAVRQTLKQLEARLMDCAAVGLIGIGDGFVLGTLARVSPKLFMGMQVCVHLFEPDLSLLHTCLLLHDFTGPHGPIEQKRFQWFVGGDWDQRYVDELSRDRLLPRPAVIVQQSAERNAITPTIHALVEASSRREIELQSLNEAHYAKLNASDFARQFDPASSERKPRVLLLTSRFTTVLQYATRGAAEGFRAFGWEALVHIEPSQHHQISKLSMYEALATFKPDLVFQIDHLRYEHEEVFPANLPFATWIQDHLAHLTDVNTGRRVGPRDYVLTFASPLFVDTYRYPARQCIDMPMMLTTPRLQLPTRIEGAPDVVYVSNVSHDPRQLEASQIERAAPAMRDVMKEASRRIVAEYDAGRSLPSRHDLRQVIDQVCAAGGLATPDPETARQLIEILWNPLNITLYRQQSLAWAAEAASALGLSLGIYGRGWETHPLFARHARGIIENGEPLAQLTRSAKINLNLEPYTCFTHQRLLDGLVAGGFFLVRDHPGNLLLQELCNFLVDHLGESVQTLNEARRSCPSSLRPKLDELLHRAACVTFEDAADPVRQVRCWQRSGVLIRQDTALPHLEEVSFADPASCRKLIGRYMHAAAEREAISQAQRASIEHRLNFAAGMKLVTRRIVELLKNEGKSDISSTPEAA